MQLLLSMQKMAISTSIYIFHFPYCLVLSAFWCHLMNPTYPAIYHLVPFPTCAPMHQACWLELSTNLTPAVIQQQNMGGTNISNLQCVSLHCKQTSHYKLKMQGCQRSHCKSRKNGLQCSDFCSCQDCQNQSIDS